MSSRPDNDPPGPLVRWLLFCLALVVAAAVVMTARRSMIPSPTAVPPTPLSPTPQLEQLPPPVVESASPQAVAQTPTSHLPLVANYYAACQVSTKPNDSEVSLEGVRAVWQPLTLSFTGPPAEASDAVNPFLDFRLQVQLMAPSGRIYDVPGYFGGAGPDGGALWRARFAADEPGRWRYCASFRIGPQVAVALDPLAGTPIAFDGTFGAFEVAEIDHDAPDFFRWGRLEYVGEHYLKFRDGPYWLKGGVNSPENFLAYAGFSNTVDQGGIIPDFLHSYAAHSADSRPDDPTFEARDAAGETTGIGAAGIIGALNYLSEQHVNSIYFLPMNLGGDGQDTYPYLSPQDNTRFDVAKLDQWGVVLEHAQRRGIALHVVLNEVEEANRRWLDDGTLGVERRLFYREMVARLAYLPAVKWNLSEEVAFSGDALREFAGYLAGLDWADHPIAVHNPAGAADAVYGRLLGNPLFSATAMQFSAEQAGMLVETWRDKSAQAGRPWIIDMDENNPAGIGLIPDNAGQLRKAILYDVYFSGGAGIEWYLGYHDLPLGGDLNLEDFRTREKMWAYMWYARRFLEALPFPAMTPHDELLSGESESFGGGEVLAQAGVQYAVYLPAADPSGTLAVPPGGYEIHWYDPRTGEFTGDVSREEANNDGLPLGTPPHSADSDWVALVISELAAMATPTVVAYP